MRAWLPNVSISETTMCFDDGEAEGPLVTLAWLGWYVEFAIARRIRTVTDR